MLRVSLVTMVLTALVSALPVHASTIGEDGLHKQEWFTLTFKDLAEDMAEANAEGKRLAIVFEQAGCIYCEKMHDTVLSDPEVVDYVKEHYIVVQYNLYGDEEVTDLDGEVLTEKKISEKWDIRFTPTWIFLPETAGSDKSAAEVAIGQMPGAFGKGTFLDLFTWIYDKGYEGEETFQRYHARRISERRDAAGGDTVPTD
ncbi:MAG: thioredoxin family protein [Gammaproteobacteria bacterium]|nr:thioredoxin family protein [Gammaproteobacteria bacterium]